MLAVTTKTIIQSTRNRGGKWVGQITGQVGWVDMKYLWSEVRTLK